MKYTVNYCLFAFTCLVCFLICILVNSPVHAAVFKQVDSEGRVTYTDKPDTNAKPVNMKSGEVEAAKTPTPAKTGPEVTIQETSAPSGQSAPSASPGAVTDNSNLKTNQTTPKSIMPPPKKKPPIYSISLISPENKQTFHNNGDPVIIKVAVMPQLEIGDNIVVYVDGAPATEPTNDTEIEIPPPGLDRGSHTIQARIIQPNGTGAETQIITIYQQRQSILLPVNRGP